MEVSETGEERWENIETGGRNLDRKGERGFTVGGGGENREVVKGSDKCEQMI